MEPDPGLISSPAGNTQLVRRPGPPPEHTQIRETDARTALTRGLREYLETLSIDWVGGRQSRFTRVYDQWAAPENVAEFPSCAIYSPGEGTYEAHTLTQSIKRIGVTQYGLRKAAELTLPLTVEAWINDPRERTAVAAMLEDALFPVEWEAGFHLELPHYHNARATFLASSSTYRDGVDTNGRRVLLVVFSVMASVDVLRFVGPIPLFQPSYESVVDDGTGDGTGEPLAVFSNPE